MEVATAGVSECFEEGELEEEADDRAGRVALRPFLLGLPYCSPRRCMASKASVLDFRDELDGK